MFVICQDRTLFLLWCQEFFTVNFSLQNPPQTLTVLDTKQALQGKAAILATIKVGAFPRELTLEAGRQRLLLTNYNSDTLSIIDITKLPT